VARYYRGTVSDSGLPFWAFVYPECVVAGVMNSVWCAHRVMTSDAVERAVVPSQGVFATL
jgi:hypothetical protein